MIVYIALLIYSSFLTIISVNAIYSVFFLILCFIFSSIIFLSFGAEFIALLLLVIYVGAISILFLFVIMMLNLRIVELYNTFLNYLPVGAFFGFFLFIELFYFLTMEFFSSPDNTNYQSFNVIWNSLTDVNLIDTSDNVLSYDWVSQLYYQSNVSYIGYVLYNYYGHLVVLAALSLLISMIGSIVLTVNFEYRDSSSTGIVSDKFELRPLLTMFTSGYQRSSDLALSERYEKVKI